MTPPDRGAPALTARLPRSLAPAPRPRSRRASSGSPFGPLPQAPPAETPTPTPPPSIEAQQETDRTLLFVIGGGLLVLFVVIGRTITRDARKTLRERATTRLRRRATRARTSTRARRRRRRARRRRRSAARAARTLAPPVIRRRARAGRPCRFALQARNEVRAAPSSDRAARASATDCEQTLSVSLAPPREPGECECRRPHRCGHAAVAVILTDLATAHAGETLPLRTRSSARARGSSSTGCSKPANAPGRGSRRSARARRRRRTRTAAPCSRTAGRR